MRHLAMILLTVLVFAGCSKNDDDDDYLSENEFFEEFNVKVKDLYGSWKLVKFIDSDGKTYDLNQSFFIKDLSTCKELISVTEDFSYGSDLQVVDKHFEDAVIFNYPSNLESSVLTIQVVKKKSVKFYDGNVYVLVLGNTVDTEEKYQVDVYGLNSLKLEGKTIKCNGDWNHVSYCGGTTDNFIKNGTYIIEKI